MTGRAIFFCGFDKSGNPGHLTIVGVNHVIGEQE
jgi:hypothetical protein